MQFVSFFEMFPELTNTEFRNVFVKAHPVIPAGNYAFAEFYCAKTDCDCRKTMIQVITSDPLKVWAVINYGWESEKFYKKWFGYDHDEGYKSMVGASLDLISPISAIAEELLALFKAILTNDKLYAKRIVSHYWKVKEFAKIKEKQETVQNKQLIRVDRKIGRNDICHCGSGKKFKNCCLLH